ncbi:transcriptional regulator-like protein [Burkholderia pseudomallei]|uniref:WYL domain-containing protein n=1 Tax=Burkholderia pseudomallei TaxID=28450 RepID=UPI000F053032|nr:WYL domain-containing protein [Burkholderia pseudomallei]CAJ5232289.1 transcriptional regulator-like protein [Burkholderia pseudomallei]CAJ7564280.1 transcriptional regulator-like protein [Burkholderia pseudomallei]CAK0346886.1 transcriptional regulator-like protein [Burkholderia pseudomallei]VCH22755.1 transcriptional regulator-like protein [Burkholderia pseudomallei]VCH61581.1 transcriptional regulator-like protein [Burkholderia pseudomallei]
MSNEQLADLTQPQRDRLAFIELRVLFIGEIRRQDLVTRFAIQSAAATRDLALYKDLAPGNIDYDAKAKSYVLGSDFKPVFDFPPERVLTCLTQGFGDGEPTRLKTWVVSEIPSRLTYPDLDVLACVTRAIHQVCPLSIEYNSISSGCTEREIVPFALIDNGLRWHVRAFDRNTEEFRDFVITRIKRPRVLKGQPVDAHETSDQDIQWTRIVELELVPHPDQPRPEITEMDYGMQNGVLRMKLRAATAGYILRKWSVDCSPEHNLRGPEYRLWLRDHLAIYGVRSAVLAPGYRSPDLPQEVELD